MCFTSNTNQELFIKSSQLLDSIREKIIKELFEVTSEEVNSLSQVTNQSIADLTTTLKDEIINSSNNKEPIAKKRKSKVKTEFIASFPDMVNENEIKQICEQDNDINDMIQILNAGSYQKAMHVFELLSNDFFSNTYIKNNTQLDKQTAKLRKYSCVKMKQKIQKIVNILFI